MSAGPLSRVDSIEAEFPGALAHRKAAMEKSLAASERALAMQEDAINRAGQNRANSPLLAFAAGVGGATKTGSFGEALSKGIGNYAEADSREQRTELEKALRLAQIAKTRADLASTAGDIPLDGLMKSLEAITKIQGVRDATAPVPSLSGYNPGGVAPVAQAATMSAPAPVQPTPATPPTPAVTAPPPAPAPAPPAATGPDFDGTFGAAPTSAPSSGPGAPVQAAQAPGAPPASPFPPTPAQAQQRATQQLAQQMPTQPAPPQPAPPQPAPPQPAAPVPQSDDEFLRSIAVPPPGTPWHEAYKRVLHATENPGLYVTPRNKAILNEAQQAYQTYTKLPEVQGKVEAYKAARQQAAEIAKEQRAFGQGLATKSYEQELKTKAEAAKSEKDFISEVRQKAGEAVSGLDTAKRLRMYMDQPVAGTGPVKGLISEGLDLVGLGGTQNLQRLGTEQWLAAIKSLQGLGALSNNEGDRIAKMVIGTRSNRAEAMQAIDFLQAGYERAAAMPQFVRMAMARGASAGETKEAWDRFRQQEVIERFDAKGNPAIDKGAIKRWQEYLPGGRKAQDIYGGKGGGEAPAPARARPDTAQSQNPVKISSDDEFDKLAPGTLFIGPDGKPRRKP